jgi:soluble cytochrome b562
MRILSILSVILLLPCAALLRADDTPLEGQMKILARSARLLSAQINDPSKQQENINLLETMKKAATDSMSLDPSMTKTVQSTRVADFLQGYRKKLDELRSALDQVETALKSSEYSKANSLMNQVSRIKKEGHSLYNQD